MNLYSPLGQIEKKNNRQKLNKCEYQTRQKSIISKLTKQSFNQQLIEKPLGRWRLFFYIWLPSLTWSEPGLG